MDNIDDYLFLSSSAPTILHRHTRIKKSQRWEVLN